MERAVLMYYYFIFFLLAMICLPFDHVKSKENKMVFIIMLIIIFSIISGFRVGVKPDWYNYSWVFENFQVDKMFNYGAYSKEPGYMILNYMTKFIFDSKYMMFYVVSFISISLTFLSYYKMSLNPFLCILIYSSFFFVNRDMGAIRAGLAYSFFLFSISFISNKPKFYLFNLLGFSIHFTSILSFIIPSIFRFFNNRKYLLYMLFFSFLFYFSGMSHLLLNMLSKLGVSIISNKATAYMGSQELTYDIGLFDITNIKNVILSLIGIYFFKDLSERNKFFSVILTTYVVGTSFRVAFSDLGVIAGRGYAIFNTVEPLMIASLLSIRMNRFYFSMIYIIIICFSFTLLDMSISKYTTFPYVNYIFSSE